ncbi:MAG: DUF4342 domain-containing protein [Chloroflexi bacterium]|nr:DUF4342 domain-containing protein [Chloroflexota bacterium]
MAIVLEVFGTIGNVLKAIAVTEGVIRLTGLDEEDAQGEQPITDSETSEEQPMSDEPNERTLIDEIEVEGRQLAERVREIIREGNARTLRIKDSKGKYHFEIPLTVGVVAGGVFALMSPTIAALSALGGLVAKFTIEVVHDAEPEKPAEPTEEKKE